MAARATEEKDDDGRTGASSGMNLTRFDDLMDRIFDGAHGQDGRARALHGPSGVGDVRGDGRSTELAGVPLDLGPRSPPQSPWLPGLDRPSFGAYHPDGAAGNIFGGYNYSHHDNKAPYYSGYAHTGAGSVYGAPVPGVHYARTAPAAHYGAAVPGPLSMHYQMGYSMHHPLATVHGMYGYFGAGATNSHMAHVGMPHAAGNDMAPSGLFGGALQESKESVSSCKTSKAAAARAARVKKLRARRHERMMNGGNTASPPSPHMEDCSSEESSPTPARRRGRRARVPNNREERRIRNRASVQLCRHKKKQKFEGLDQEKELYETETHTMSFMVQRHKRLVSRLRDLVPPQVGVMCDDAVAFFNTPPTNRRAEFRE